MQHLTVSEVARQAGLRASAIRYYEQMKILLPAIRVSGQRRYHPSVLYRLAVVRVAQEAGFTLEEIRRLLLGSGKSTPISARWNKLADAKISELNARIEQIQAMKELLLKLKSCCRCETVDQCGAGLLQRLKA
jgi:MerR family transcriptional regulator, redox-sensitive transcriptional activator SoxR